MKITTSTKITVTAFYHTSGARGVLTFSDDGLDFKPSKITHKTPEFHLDYSDIQDALVEKILMIPSSVTIVLKNTKRYTLSTTKANAIMKFLDDKF